MLRNCLCHAAKLYWSRSVSFEQVAPSCLQEDHSGRYPERGVAVAIRIRMSDGGPRYNPWPPRLVLLGLCVKIHSFSFVTEVFLDFQQVVQLYKKVVSFIFIRTSHTPGS